MADRQIDELSFATDISDATTFAANNNAATYEAQQVSVGQIATFMGARADAVHNLGDLHYNKSNLAIDNPGAVPGWTGEYVTNANNVYPDLYTWLKTSHPELCITRSAYDAAITADGECRYFVVDEESGSIRFPKYTYTAPDYPWIYCFNAAVPQTTTQGAEYTTSLISKVSKAGDTMTGQLKMSGENEVRFGTDDNYYLVQCSGNGQLSIFNKNNKGIFLQLEEAHAPFYWDGTNGYRLLTTADLQNLDYVVEHYNDGTNWYRKYKSGWLEQGGTFPNIPANSARNITFLKPFANTSYTALCTPNNITSERGDKRENWGLYKQDSTYCQMANNSETKTVTFSWYTCGQGA